MTLFLTKDGPPAEEGWYSPEELVKISGAQPRYDLAFVPPGKTGFTDKLAGTFPSGTHAVLRVYPGEKEVYDLAKTPPDQRTDFILAFSTPNGSKPVCRNLSLRMFI